MSIVAQARMFAAFAARKPADSAVRPLGAGRPWEQQYDFNTSQSGALGSWTADTAHPTVDSQIALAYQNGKAIRMRSLNLATESTINANGSMTTWSSSGLTAPTEGVFDTYPILVNDKLYYLGGRYGSSSTLSNKIYTLDVNASTIFPPNLITEASTLNYAVRSYPLIFATKGRVYIVGGYTTTTIDDQQWAPIDGNGDVDITDWTTESAAFPINIRLGQVAVVGSRVYSIGGYDGSANTNKVYYATIDAAGAIGSWADSGYDLPQAVRSHAVAVTNDTIYVIGGYTTGYITDVSRATINGDDTLSSWTTESSVLASANTANSFITNSRIYVYGTNNSTNINYVSFSGGRNDYSSTGS